VFAEAVPFIADKLREMAWVGRVADIDGGMVTLNAGETAGVHAGDTFTVLREIKRVTDPQTGEVLRVVQAPIGQVQVFEVQERSSTAKPADGTVAQVGDTVQFVKP
jgi:hypothetical protein